MKIVVAAVSSNLYMSGVSRHAANIVRCLLTRTEVSAVHMLVSPWEYKHVSAAVSRKDSRLHIHSVPISPGTVTRNLWYYSDLPAIAKQLDADVVHISYPSPLQRGAFHCPTVLTLHDLYPYDIPANFGFPKVFFNRIVLQQCLRTADAIACVSDSTRRQLEKIMSRTIANKAVTVHNCVEPASMAAKPAFLESWKGAPFFLCVAQHRRNKNIVLVLKIFNRLLSKGNIDPATRMLVVGMPGPESGSIHRFIREANLAPRVELTSGISDAEMQWCYRHCEMLLAPSLVEGFGLPVAEGLLAGCPVICSDIPPFREVGGDNCHYVPLGPSAEEGFAKAVCEVLGKHRRLPLALPQLSGHVIAEKYMRLYLDTISSMRSSGPMLAPARSNIENRRMLGEPKSATAPDDSGAAGLW
jgi:glycosyltransferase involved in cell wall biosynthesis